MSERKEFITVGVYLTFVCVGSAMSYGIWDLLRHRDLFTEAIRLALSLAPFFFLLSGARLLIAKLIGVGSGAFYQSDRKAALGYSQERSMARGGADATAAAVKKLKRAYFWTRDTAALERAVELCLTDASLRYEGLRLAEKLRSKMKPNEREHLERKLKNAWQPPKPANS